MAVTQQDISAAIRRLGLSGRLLCIHSSLRSFGWVEGGADAVIDALLDEGCTVMAPSHYYASDVAPPRHLRPQRNGIDYEVYDHAEDARSGRGESFIYTPASNEVSSDYMGAIPTALLQRPERQRGNHPGGSFAALGPLARALIQDQTPTEPFAPFEALGALGGSAVLMGVGLDKLTLLHQAEVLAGRNPFMRWANGPDGQPIAMFGGGCSRGFVRLEPVQPSITHCGRQGCLECRDAILGGPILNGF